MLVVLPLYSERPCSGSHELWVFGACWGFKVRIWEQSMVSMQLENFMSAPTRVFLASCATPCCRLEFDRTA